MKKRKKHFAKLRVEEKRRKPPTKAQKRNLMSTYLKNMGGYKYNQLKRKSYDEIQKLFDNEMNRVNTFIPLDSKVMKSKEGTEDELESDKSKKEESSKKKAEGSRKKSIVQDDEEIAIDVIPLATKPPIIVEYKIVKEGQKGFYHLIRADGSLNRYSLMIRMLQMISREDLETLWKLVKTKHGNTRPEDDYEKVFWGDLKVICWITTARRITTVKRIKTSKEIMIGVNFSEDLDAYDSNCDDVSNAKVVLMVNLSNYGSDVILEVPHSDSYHNDLDNQGVHAMKDFEQTPVVDFPDNEISSDSNIIPYS
ncbi:hypothetical protein Tco_0260421 [Tanacetum coccineum]